MANPVSNNTAAAVHSTNEATRGLYFAVALALKIWFGWWLYQSGSTPPEFDLWLDDIALGTKPLGR